MLQSTRLDFLQPSVRWEASIHSDSVGWIFTSLITKDGSSGWYVCPRSTVLQCCLPVPRKNSFDESEGETWKDMMPDFSSSADVFSIFQFCRDHVRPSSPERYTKFFCERTNTVFLSLPTH